MCIFSGLVTIPLRILICELRGKQLKFSFYDFGFSFITGALFPLIYYGFELNSLFSSICFCILTDVFGLVALLNKLVQLCFNNYFILVNGAPMKAEKLDAKILTKYLLFADKSKEVVASSTDSSPEHESSSSAPTVPIRLVPGPSILPVAGPSTSPVAASSISSESAYSTSFPVGSAPYHRPYGMSVSGLVGVSAEGLRLERDSLTASYHTLNHTTPGKPIYLTIQDVNSQRFIAYCSGDPPRSAQYNRDIGAMYNSAELRQIIAYRIYVINYSLNSLSR